MSPERRRSKGRTAAEWATLIASMLIVGGLLVLVGAQYLGEQSPAAITVTPLLDETREESGVHYLPLEIRNTGERTAEDIVVRVTVREGDREESAEITVRILAGGGTEEAVAAFTIPPTRGNVEARVVGYLRP